MKLQTISLIAIAVVAGGCMNGGKSSPAGAADGEGNEFALKADPIQGPGGGGNEDQTWPESPAYKAPNGSTASAFPSAVQPEVLRNQVRE